MYFIMNTFQMNLVSFKLFCNFCKIDFKINNFQIPKEFKILRAQSCADTEDYPIKIENLLFKQSEINQYQIAGKIVIRENIIEPIGVCFIYYFSNNYQFIIIINIVYIVLSYTH